MKDQRAVWVAILILVAILAASYFDQKDQESFEIDEQMRQAEIEALQPK